jgi:hemolysin III
LQFSSERSENANTITHGIGVLASIAGGTVLIVRSAFTADPAAIVGCSIFVVTLILLYSASTIYHAAPHGPLKQQLKRLDHCAIYTLIAGTYTPIALAGLRGAWGWSLFGVTWGLALLGVLFKVWYTGRYPRLSTAIYVGMGWLALVAVVPLVTRLPFITLSWLVAGGIAYTGGTAFYHNRRIPYAHAIWHGFVLVGSVCHAIAIGTQLQ